ncbi:MAG: hypothetical protein IPG93_10080 [Burkholderiales bacterium]|nr:hypothetical protein [Burkholderiales bacterium]
MEYNPYTERFSAKQLWFQKLEDEARDCSQQLTWHSKFNQITEADALAAGKREAGRIRSRLEGLKQERTSESAREENLSQNAKIGLDPRRWFSMERIQYAQQRDLARGRLAELDKAIAEHEAEAATVLKACLQRQAQLDKHRALDSLELKAKLNALELSLEQLRPELANLLADKQKVDALLSAPMLEKRELASRLATLETDVKLAERFDQRLSSAGNSYEKAMVHQECSNTFGGEGSPGRVMQNKQKEMLSARRNLEKVEERLKQISRRANRQISTLVIDGNNLCYAGREFIGLKPLYALTYGLAENYRVIVVFDANIRKILRMNDQQVAYGFPREVMVHIVASKQAADETVLETASASDAYVISNDRFRDFTDKAAVYGQRLIRHEIVAGKVLIHELNLAVAFEQEGREHGSQHAI